MPTWDVKNATGTPVTTMTGLAAVLRVDVKTAAHHLLGSPEVAAAAPPGLLAEATETLLGKAAAPPISSGSYVGWSGGHGRVDLIVTDGAVPGVADDVEGTVDSPAARVVVWEDGKPTRRKIAAAVHTLRRIPPITTGPEGKAGEPARLLVGLHASHERSAEALGLPAWQRVPGAAVKAAFDRGVAGWPGGEVTTLSRDEWALDRAATLLDVAVGRKSADATADGDLLHPAHPAARVRLSAGEVDAQIKALLSGR